MCARIWVLTRKEDPASLVKTVRLIVCALNQRIDPCLIEEVFEEDLLMKMDTETGLSLLHKGSPTLAPAVVLTRISGAHVNIDFLVTLLTHLEMMGARVVNPSRAVMKAINKVLHLQVLALHRIPVSTTLSYPSKSLANVDMDVVHSEVGSPFIMKAVKGLGGNNVFMVPSENPGVRDLMGSLRHEVPYLFQKYVHESHGRDLRIIVVDKKAVFSMIRVSNTGSLQANLSQGGSGKLVTGQYPDAESLAERIANVLEMDIAGVDLLFSDKFGYVCCEVNNNPGFAKPEYDNSGIEGKIADMVVRLAKDASCTAI
jgi:RimK family alpha-L-glutamate ligase